MAVQDVVEAHLSGIGGRGAFEMQGLAGGLAGAYPGEFGEVAGPGVCEQRGGGFRGERQDLRVAAKRGGDKRGEVVKALAQGGYAQLQHAQVLVESGPEPAGSEQAARVGLASGNEAKVARHLFEELGEGILGVEGELFEVREVEGA